MHWNTQAGNITTNLKVKIYFTLLAFSMTNFVTLNFCVDDSAKGRYDMILVRYLLTELGLNLKFFEHVIKSDDGDFNGPTIPMVDLGAYIFKYLNAGKITPEESFTNDYAKEVYESWHVHNSKTIRVILNAKYEKLDSRKVMENQCQHLKMTQCNEFLELIPKFEELFDGILGTWKIDPLEFELKENAKPICSRPYAVPRYTKKCLKNRLNFWFYY